MQRSTTTSGIALWLLALAPAAAAAPKEEAIRQAVERGVAYLKAAQNADGTWPYAGPRATDPSHAVGVSALVGLALLECDVPANDPVIENAASVVRAQVIGLSDTYDLSLAVLFLDRLGDREDHDLIEAISLSLVAGQMGGGGWGYTCPPVPGEAEARRLRTRGENRGAEDREGPSAMPRGRRPPGFGEGPGGRGVFQPPASDDNSNTQFATLALWVARRHGVQVDRALAAVEQRFRRSQNADGGWSYWASPTLARAQGAMGSTASMTCAGLLGLAVGYGITLDAVLRTEGQRPPDARPAAGEKPLPDPSRDEVIRGGIRFVGLQFEPALLSNHPGGVAGPRGRGPGRWGGSRVGNVLSSEYYFLWSLERVAVVYGLKTIGKKDWYALGSTYLLRTQERNGAWAGNLGEIVDTCFALFFLRRANLAGDLTATLRRGVGDTTRVQLRAHAGDDRFGEESGRVSERSRKPDPSLSRTDNRPQLEPPGGGVVSRPPSSAASADPEVARLRDQLVRAAPQDQSALLDKLRDGKGSANTDALAEAITRLGGAARTKARDALAERLARMTAATLRDKLRDGLPEVRRATALACAMKDEKGFVPDLIGLLEDPEPRVARAAHAALVALTRQDLGPANGAAAAERTQAATRWRDWWTSRK
jgi:hypothetical protein